MISLMASGIDLECGSSSTTTTTDDDDEEVSCFYGDESPTKLIILHLVDRDCRICHLSLVDDAIELGCCCKNDLAAAHKHCAETWFKIKGNKTCEICNSIVTNLVIPIESPGMMMTDVNLEATSVARSTARGRGCINGHRILNFILACLVFAFVISWLFHFNIPS
ncbi:hypothetical protein R6Q59_019447 [Mikania micrantha]|uniref:RING-CH-type domain-containing protein n=1 Tax=Mikania micrantha TaxID=192012 RepID=A0A5N6LXK8_9ASTR|nr:hypothetical protein E3N88_34255 [Mikania micrantha]